MQIKWDFAGSTNMWPTSAGGQLIEVANLTGFTVVANKDATAQSRSVTKFCCSGGNTNE
jgi:hypothetical protein